MSDVWADLGELLDRFDSDVKFESGSMTAYSGTLRLTLTDPDGAPSRSVTFHTVGHGEPADAARALIADYHEWSKEGIVPLPVPDWMRP